MGYRILIAETFYEQYLEDYYRRNQAVVELPYAEQLAHLIGERFSSGDAYVTGLRAQGCDASMVILNARPLQRRWAREQGLSATEDTAKWNPTVFIAQVQALHPDVVYIQELSAAGDQVVEAVKPFTRLVVGQIACSLPARRTFAHYDLIVSSWKPIVEYFRARGCAAEFCRLAFDQAVLPLAADQPPKYDVTFVGGLSGVHAERIALLEHLCAREVPIDIFGYGADRLPQDSLIHGRHRGAAWGLDGYRVMAASTITINCHGTIAVPGYPDPGLANNLRLFESTGVGTMLLTDWKRDLNELFTPGTEVATYEDPAECVRQIEHHLSHPDERSAIARMGQQRTLKEHTYAHRMQWLSETLGALV